MTTPRMATPARGLSVIYRLYLDFILKARQLRIYKTHI